MAPSPFTVETPLVTLAVSVRDGALTAIGLNRRGTRRPVTELEREVARELRAYANGALRTFSVPIEPEGTEFDRLVWRALRRIPYGETRTYGDIAKAIGKPRSARAVGAANNRNPIPIVIPCHRVVAAGGKLGGYGGGLALKRKLLDLETRGAMDGD